MKESFYFPHDYNAFEDKKILRLRRKWWMEWYGVFRNIIERLAAEWWYMNIDSIEDIAFAMQMQCDCITSVIHDFSLFDIDAKWNFSSWRLLSHLDERMKRSSRARKSANDRWKAEENANAMQPHSESNANAIERKGKERKKKGKENKINTIPIGIDDVTVVSDQEEKIAEVPKKKKWRTEEERVAVYDAMYKLKQHHEKHGVAYIADDERIFMHHILFAKSFGEHCEKLKVDRLEYAKNVLIASIQLQYLKWWVASWPKAIYLRHSEIFNEAQKLKQQRNESKWWWIAKPPSLSSEK